MMASSMLCSRYNRGDEVGGHGAGGASHKSASAASQVRVAGKPG